MLFFFPSFAILALNLFINPPPPPTPCITSPYTLFSYASVQERIFVIAATLAATAAFVGYRNHHLHRPVFHDLKPLHEDGRFLPPPLMSTDLIVRPKFELSTRPKYEVVIRPPYDLVVYLYIDYTALPRQDASSPPKFDSYHSLHALLGLAATAYSLFMAIFGFCAGLLTGAKIQEFSATTEPLVFFDDLIEGAKDASFFPGFTPEESSAPTVSEVAPSLPTPPPSPPAPSPSEPTPPPLCEPTPSSEPALLPPSEPTSPPFSEPKPAPPHTEEPSKVEKTAEERERLRRARQRYRRNLAIRRAEARKLAEIKEDATAEVLDDSASLVDDGLTLVESDISEGSTLVDSIVLEDLPLAKDKIVGDDDGFIVFRRKKWKLRLPLPPPPKKKRGRKERKQCSEEQKSATPQGPVKVEVPKVVESETIVPVPAPPPIISVRGAPSYAMVAR